LDRPLLLTLRRGAEEQKAQRAFLHLGLPPLLEVRQFLAQPLPSFACFDRSLEFHEPLEGDADGEFDARLVQGRDDLVAEKALSTRSSITTPGKARRTAAMQASRDSRAPGEP
jgi:hypothetical protein